MEDLRIIDYIILCETSAISVPPVLKQIFLQHGDTEKKTLYISSIDKNSFPDHYKLWHIKKSII